MTQLAHPVATVALPLAAGFILSLIGTGLVRRYALRRLLDVPNARSSHRAPTPRGGGLGFVLIILAALPLGAWFGLLGAAEATGLFGAGLMVAAIGFADDHRHVPARWRLLVHGVATAWGLAWLGGVPPAILAELQPLPGWLANGLAWLALIWLLNLYNFMDGIDGLAATEACCVLGGAVLLALLVGASAGLVALLALSCGAVAGFLRWNLPPARIFMGDVGSGFLGMMLGLLAVATAKYQAQAAWSWFIMLTLFTFDASYTLLRRTLRGERVYEAHRCHGYQRLARRWGSHARVTASFAAVTIAWLIPWAMAVGSRTVSVGWGLLFACAPIVLLGAWSGAGREQKD